ncbi:MAG: SRPBCC family protein [Thermoanaerobaculia bacterium]
MTRTTVTRVIAAPVERVFETVADVENFKRAVPHIVDVEFLSQRRRGIGTRFRETRRSKGNELTTELEVTEYVVNDRVRMVADSHGTIWDSVFAVRGVPAGTELTLTMDAKAHQLLAKLTNPLVMRAIQGAIENDLDLVKRFCEQPPDETG